MELDQKSVLVVDDELDILRVIKRSLEVGGGVIHVYAFTSPIEALEHFKLNFNNFALVLPDIRMPGMNGFEFIRRIRQINPTIKALLMSSFEFNNNERSSALGSIIVDDFVQKPVSPRKLTSIVQRHIVKAGSYYNTSM
ncbi:MAG: response regulator [Nitrososphaeraceae archaeon]